ncbi:MAG TPA: hypothetical protein VHS06_07740 [Chloroflexota bacterium]|nr:hypothetical protein [Chloroflexota bacterium]
MIGFLIEHSISPAIHQPALDTLGITARYERLRVAPEGLRSFVEGLRGGGWLGVNVTVPHKEAVVPLLDALDTEAEAIGAVNTIVATDATLVGYNTDARDRGVRTLGGLPMLVYQAAASFELWTGRAAPVEIMMKAAEGALV